MLVRLSLAASLVLTATATVQVGNEEYAGRRQQAMERLSDGILLLHARSEGKSEDQPSFRQDASFFYFTGLAEQPGAILALDAPRQESLLFAPPAPISFGRPVPGVGVTPGSDTARQLTLTRVEHWDRFLPWLRQRLDEASVPLYVDEPRRVESTGSPAGLRPVAGPMALWRTALEEAFPEATIASALQVIRELRWVKSSAEVELLIEGYLAGL